VVSVGRAIASSALRIRDGEGHALPERCVGEVCVRGPSVMSGYLDNPEATAEAIREGELRTGDLGYLAGGELFIVGRIKHMLIVRGKNYFAEDIEAAVEQVPGVRKGNAVAFGVGDERRGEQLQLVVETRLRRDEERRELEQRIGEAVAEAVGLTPRAIVLVPANTLPKTSSGKKRRGRCREMVASGEIVAGTRRKRASSGVGTLVRSQLAFAGHKLRKSFGASAPLRLSTSS